MGTAESAFHEVKLNSDDDTSSGSRFYQQDSIDLLSLLGNSGSSAVVPTWHAEWSQSYENERSKMKHEPVANQQSTQVAQIKQEFVYAQKFLEEVMAAQELQSRDKLLERLTRREQERNRRGKRLYDQNSCNREALAQVYLLLFGNAASYGS
jgi:hypothetical protein